MAETRCAICQSFTLKNQPLGNSHGMFTCQVMPKWTYFSPFVERECDKFKEVPDSQLQARLDWEKKA